MSAVTLTLPDGKNLEVETGSSFGDAVGQIGEGLRRNAVAVTVNGVHHTLAEAVSAGGEMLVITRNSDAGLATLRHSTAHLLAWAVRDLFPEVKFAFGPDIDTGFYYDFDKAEPFGEDDLARIEKRMLELARSKVPIERKEVSRSEAEALFKDQPYKQDQIASLGEAQLSTYSMGEFTDLCEGPHVPDTSLIKAFKLLSVAGAYWRGDSDQPMLQRIYGTAFYKQKDLDDHLEMLEEARKRDHRKLGRELDLFGSMEEAGPGFSFWFPRGDILREQIIGYWKEIHRQRGYVTVTTPHIFQAGLWETSGHMQFYRDDMYVFEHDGRPFVVKPMNCPGHILIFKRKSRGHRSLPVRYAELGTVYRAEDSGALHGLMRVRGFTQDDAHIFCTPEQLEDEVASCLDLVKAILGRFGFDDFKVELSVRDPQNKAKYAGSDEEWDAAEASLVRALELHGLEYTREEGEAVFYGPKIDVKLIDALGRRWQSSTIQFDFNLPRRFDVTYTDHDGEKRYVYMVHRAILGSLERFIGILTEHFAGDFPLWLAPEQVRVMSVSRDQHDYADEVATRLEAAGIRAGRDVRDEKIGFKIREAEMLRVPWMLVVGGREAENDEVSLRIRHQGDQGSRSVKRVIEELLDAADPES
ncbi:threonine--tRNA ligase [bacterium]|nr:threonine--tRNA ligase [bacterium]PIV80380.1 MAG: threonine--tRNA ligase [bacterium CG17_big_fil_post_rev_8_21_14_2_50_64_8]PJA75593.1 MAG: threonine--tRNA ligase [bacterium CG_4_9_14_3_um_filter_65_15]